MSNQLMVLPLEHSAHQTESNFPSNALQYVRRFSKAAHRALTVAGVVALAVLAMMFFSPDFADRIMALSPFAANDAVEAPVASAVPVAATTLAISAPALGNLMNAPQTSPMAQIAPIGLASTATLVKTTPSAEDRSIVGTPRQQKLVTNWLSKRYRVAADATDMLVSAAYLTARDTKLDPLLILAVVAIESGFNPFAESPMGAQGLMQVMSKIHHDKFQQLGGIKAALNPVANIKVGSMILKEYVTRSGSIEGGLKSYVGAAEMENDNGYGFKVLSEYQRLKEVSNGKNVPVTTVNIVARPRPAPVEPKLVTQPADFTASNLHKEPGTEELAKL